ncbi:MAG: DUF3849 domain-containing protein [Oscillospiraceae bacterium]|jgi:hypothetical protein|nr:DUF3849 domain-containing protein [Oscillospiraceae bacterium]
MDGCNIYPHSLEYAKQNGELELWREDMRQNNACAKAIDEAIRACNYEQYRYKFSEAVNAVVGKFGYERVTRTLAGTVAGSDNDGRFTSENRQWAQRFGIPHDHCSEFVFDTHRYVLDGFISSVRKAHVEMLAQEVGQYEKSHRMAERNRLTWYHSDFGVFVPNANVSEERLMKRYAEIMEKKAERQSVLKQIREAEKVPKPPRKPKAPDKKREGEDR